MIWHKKTNAFLFSPDALSRSEELFAIRKGEMFNF